MNLRYMAWLPSASLVPLVAILFGGPALAQGTSPDTTSPAARFSARGPGGVIPDGAGAKIDGAPFRSTVTVPSSVDGLISHVSVDFHGLQHTWPGDLVVRLIHPDGKTSIDLFNRPGRGSSFASAEPGQPPISSVSGYQSDFVSTNQYSFSDNGTVLFKPYITGPFGSWQREPTIQSGVYRPTSNRNQPQSTGLKYRFTPDSFATTFGGTRPAGEWTLEIIDWAFADLGSLEGWTLNLCTGGCPAAPPLGLGDEIFKLTPFSPEVSNFAPHPDAMAVSGDTAIVGAPGFVKYRSKGQGELGAGQSISSQLEVGRAHLFDLKTGREVSVLFPTDLGWGSSFGTSVAISENTAIVGAYGDQGNVKGLPSGAVYVYDVTDPANPVERGKLLPAEATGLKRWNFGIAVALTGNLAFVAQQVEGKNNVLDATARVTLFDLTTGEELARLTPSDFAPGDGFGNFMAISGNKLIVGAPFKHLNAGAAYVFDVSQPRSPVQLFKLMAADATSHDAFGQAVSIDGNLIVVGAPFRNEGVNEEGNIIGGGAYVFDATTGEQLAQIRPLDPIQPGEHPSWSATGLGNSVSISGSAAVIGSPFAHDGSYRFFGAAHLFDLSNPRQPVRIFRFSPSDGVWNDWFGMSTVIDGDRILIAAPQNWSWGGKAFLYQGPRR